MRKKNKNEGPAEWYLKKSIEYARKAEGHLFSGRSNDLSLISIAYGLICQNCRDLERQR
ncbi:MAG: hypothetical protein HZB99_02800 [Candidatus Harrisonbacteria bacterium]|nr:hypothetical protein [Candidatus Harrisonbacteria bacterium]